MARPTDLIPLPIALTEEVMVCHVDLATDFAFIDNFLYRNLYI